MYEFFHGEGHGLSEEVLKTQQYHVGFVGLLVCVTEQHYVSIFFTSLCANLYFLIHRILKFQDSQLRMRIDTKPNGKQK